MINPCFLYVLFETQLAPLIEILMIRNLAIVLVTLSIWKMPPMSIARVPYIYVSCGLSNNPDPVQLQAAHSKLLSRLVHSTIGLQAEATNLRGAAIFLCSEELCFLYTILLEDNNFFSYIRATRSGG